MYLESHKNVLGCKKPHEGKALFVLLQEMPEARQLLNEQSVVQ